MLLKIFFKEWRENILVFSLSLVILLALVILNFSGQEDLTMYFSGMFLWIFLPFAALLIGSSGYYSEFRDNAWIYMFSRPVKKWQVWLTKYIALLSIFITVVLVFYILLQSLPGLKDILDDSGLFFMMGGLLAYSPFLLVSFLALTISYSISILSEKQFVLVFVSILIGTGFLYISWKYQEFLIMTYFYFRRVE
ncbi:MAG: ABC transporter permease, partial [Candidatus Aminicenantes bacterium]